MQNIKFYYLYKWKKAISIYIFLLFAFPYSSYCYQSDNWVVSLNSPNWNIPFSFLYLNDASPTQILSVSTTSSTISYPFFGTTILPSINFDAEVIQLPELGEGLYIFYVNYLPDANAPGENFSRAVFVIVSENNLINVTDCCPSNCNLVCQSDFEKFTINEPIRDYDGTGKIFLNAQTTPFKFNNYTALGLYDGSSNGAYISSDGQNKKLFLVDRAGHPTPVSPPLLNQLDDWIEYEQGHESGFIFKLRDPIEPLQTVNISFDATTFGGNYNANSSLENTYGHVRLFAMENDFSPVNTNNVEYPYTTIINPFIFDGLGTKGYYINSGLETDDFGIPVQREFINYLAPYVTDHQNSLPIGVNGLDEFENFEFNWTNNTTKTINAIMIVGDGLSPIITPITPKLETREIVDPKWYIVAVDNFEVVKGPQTMPICITGDESPICVGNCTHIIEYEICWCDEPVAKPVPRSFDVSINDVYSGVDVILPSGSFDANGIATVNFTGPSDCVTVSFEVSIDMNVGPGTIELPLNYGANGDCEMCAEGGTVISNTPAIITMSDCNFTCGCEEPNNIGTKSATTLWSSLTNTQKTKSCYAVEGTLVMDEDFTFTDKKFVMNDDATIRIGAVSVTIDTCVLQGCEALWNGIVMYSPEAILNVQRSLIEDARTGISRVRFSSALVANKNVFNNNFIGINLGQDIITSNATNIPAKITANTFTSTSLLKSSFFDTKGKLGYAGITVYKANEIIGSLEVHNINKFITLGNGIVSNLGTLSIVNNKFENIQELPYYKTSTYNSGFGIKNLSDRLTQTIIGGLSDFPPSTNSFKSVHRAIITDDLLHANNTIMADVGYGITLNAKLGSQIFSENNLMSVKRRGYNLIAQSSDASGLIRLNDIYFPISYQASAGISTNMQNFNSSSSKLIIDLNNISGKPHLGMIINNLVNSDITRNVIESSATNFYGMRLTGLDDVNIIENEISGTNRELNTVGIYMSKVLNSKFICNSATGTGTGFKTYNTNMTVDFITNHIIDNYQVGLHMTKGSTLIARKDNGIHVLAGNTWEGTTPLTTAKHDGYSDEIRRSLFKTFNSTLPYFPEDYVALNEELSLKWFQYGEGSFDPEGDCEDDYFVPGSMEWMLPFAQDSVSFSVYNPQLKSQAKHHVYEMMKRYDSVPFSLDLQDFYDNYELSAMGKINDLRTELNNLQKMPDLIKSSIDSLQLLITVNLADIFDLQEALPGSPTILQIESYIAGVENYSYQINLLKSEIKGIIDDFEDVQHDELGDMIVALSLISTPADAPSFNALEVTKIETEYLYGGSFLGLSPTALDTLLEIAGQCPDYGGQAVYWSRALVNKEYPNLTWTDETICQDTLGSPFVSDEQSFNRLNLFSQETFDVVTNPNPSTGLVKISGPQNFEGLLIIRNVNGQHLNTFKYIPTMDLDLSDSSGVLFLSWIDNSGKVVHTHRQIILE